jgi:hypothetical protein
MVTGCRPGPARGGSWASEIELPAPTGGSGGLLPQEIAGEADVLPGKWRGMREQRLGLSAIF